jgi:hypothetical protein
MHTKNRLAVIKVLLKIFIATNSVNYVSSICHAQYLTGPVASSIGGAGRAGVEAGEQHLMNPAMIAYGESLISVPVFMDGYLGPDEHDRVLGITLAESGEEIFAPGAFTYVNRRQTFPDRNTREEQFYQISMGKNILPGLVMGGGFHLREVKELGGASNTVMNLDLGFHIPLTEYAGLGLVFYNVAPRKAGIPANFQEDHSVGFGSRFLIHELVAARFDLTHQLSSNPDAHWGVNSGFEWKIKQLWVFRSGYDYDGLKNRKFWTAGLGFEGPRLVVDYSYKDNLDETTGAMHGVDFRLPFW